MGMRTKWATWEFIRVRSVILSHTIGLQPMNSACRTMPGWTRLSTSPNQDVAAAQTLSQLQKLLLGTLIPRLVVQLAQLARPMMMVQPAIYVARLVISLTIAQTVTWLDEEATQRSFGWQRCPKHQFRMPTQEQEQGRCINQSKRDRTACHWERY